MKISSLFDKNAFFRSEQEIQSWIKSSKNYKGENPEHTQLLIFFSTSKQRTYLVASQERLYCILDDARKDNPHVNWSMNKEEVMGDDQITLEISTRDKTEKTGLVNFGPKHKNWLYTKSLFVNQDLKASIEHLIKSTMKNT